MAYEQLALDVSSLFLCMIGIDDHCIPDFASVLISALCVCVCVCVCVYQSSLGSFSGRLLLGVAASCVSLYQPGEAEPLDSFPIGQICSYGISDPHTLRISTGDRDLLLQTSQVGHTHTHTTAVE